MNAWLSRKKQRKLEKLKEACNSDDILEIISFGEAPEQIKFYFDGQSDNFFVKCTSLGLYNKNENFVDFFSSDFCWSIRRESKISIHVETGNLCCENFNTNESL